MFKELRLFEHRVLLQPHSNPTGTEKPKMTREKSKNMSFSFSM